MTETSRRIALVTVAFGAVSSAAGVVWAGATLPDWAAAPATPAKAVEPGPDPATQRELDLARQRLDAARAQLLKLDASLRQLPTAQAGSGRLPTVQRVPTWVPPRAVARAPRAAPPVHTTTKASGARP